LLNQGVKIKMMQEKQQTEEQKDEVSETQKGESEAHKKHIKKSEKLSWEIEFPPEISASLDRDELKIKKDDKEISRKISSMLNVKVEGNKILLKAKKSTKRERKMLGTFKAHIKNMIKGLTEGFVYKLQASNVHFPMNASFDKEKNEFVVKNFLGEKKDRKIKVIKGVDISVKKSEIEVRSHDIEKAGKLP